MKTLPQRTKNQDPPDTTSESAGISAARIRLGRLLRPVSGNYLALLGTVVFLVLFGLVMVLSSSSVESYVGNFGFFGVFWRQGMFVLLGIPLMLLVSRLPERFWMAIAWPWLITACALQLLTITTPLGIKTGGNTNWLALGPITFQPSELVKLGLVLWLGLMVTRKEEYLGSWRRGLLPILLVSSAAIALVSLGGDLGTTMVMGIFVLGALFLVGVKLRLLAIPIVLGALAAGILAITSPSRLTRILSFLSENCTDYENGCWQIKHGLFALANGGFFGVGLGNSTAKWSWLPAADNDYIFAIIGEELGLVGAIVVLALFVLLAFTLARIMRGTTTLFSRTVVAAVLVWVIGQACMNIAVVVGIFPVLGVPLPLISAGGTALLSNMVAMGLVLSFARARPVGFGAGAETVGVRA